MTYFSALTVEKQLWLSKTIELVLEFGKVLHGNLLTILCELYRSVLSVEVYILRKITKNLVFVEINEYTLSPDTLCFVLDGTCLLTGDRLAYTFYLCVFYHWVDLLTK